MLQNNTQTAPALQVDLIAIDALFKRIAERGRKIRAQAIGDKEQAAKLSIDMPSAKDNKNTKQVGK
jgi:hypothetical protein